MKLRIQVIHLLEAVNSSPYSVSWSPSSSGTYNLTAVATDNEGATATSDAITVVINVPQGPYGNAPAPIPGTIQAENYDVGGQNSAYYDTSPGSESGVGFRAGDDVDIEQCTDNGGGYNIGYATAGEWLEYSVNVTETATYTLDLRVACNGDNRTMHIEMDGVNITGTINIPNTTGWQNWQTVTVNNINLTAGEKIMRIVIGNQNYVNINYVAFENNTITGNMTGKSLSFECFPNPYGKALTIKKPGEFEYVVTDIIETGSGKDFQAVGEALPSGIYFLTITDAGNRETRKIVKK